MLVNKNLFLFLIVFQILGVQSQNSSLEWYKNIDQDRFKLVVEKKDKIILPLVVSDILSQLNDNEVLVICYRYLHNSSKNHTANIHLSDNQICQIQNLVLGNGQFIRTRIIYKNKPIEENDLNTIINFKFTPTSQIKSIPLSTRPIFVISKDTQLLLNTQENIELDNFHRYSQDFGKYIYGPSNKLFSRMKNDSSQIQILMSILESLLEDKEKLARSRILLLEENLRKLKNDNRWTLSAEGSFGYKAAQISGLGLSGNTNISDYNVRLGVGKKLFSIGEGRAGEFHLFVGGEFGQKNISETFKLENYHDAPKVDEVNDAYYNRLNGDNLKTSLHWNTVATSMGVNYNSQPILNSKFTWTASLICIYGSNAGLLKENLEGTIRINRIYPQISDEPLFDEYFQNTSMIPVNQYTNVRFSAYDYIAWEGGLGMNINLSPDVLLGFAVRNRFWQKQSFSAENTKGDYLPVILFNPSSGSNSFFWKFGIVKIL